MFNLVSNATSRGTAHLILNAIRACNIITLLAIAVVSWVMIVMTAIRGTFFFFKAASYFFASVAAVALILTELSLFKPYVRRTWPTFSPAHGLAWLGTAMVVMGCQVMGNLNEPAIQPGKIGKELHSLVLATGTLALTFGVLNIASSILFADRKEGINARMIRSDGNLAASSAESDKVSDLAEKRASHRWTKRFTFTNAHRLKISRPIPQPQQDVESQYAGEEDWRGDRTSPIVPDVKRPDTALHPLHTGLSRYSEVSHMNRF